MEKSIIEQCRRNKTPLPPKIANAPELLFGLELYYVAFLDLTTCRLRAEGPISWLSIDDYAKRNKIKGEQKEDLFYFVGKLDEAYLKHKVKVFQEKTKVKKK